MKKEELSISLVQANVSFDTVEGNLSHLEELLESDSSESDIYLLPELFNSGYRNAFHMKAEKMGLYTTRWMKQMAGPEKRSHLWFCGHRRKWTSLQPDVICGTVGNNSVLRQGQCFCLFR
jgi:predicted amidohydrolase